MRVPPKGTRRPGDLIIDRLMPDCTPEERDEAHENLRALFGVFLAVAERLPVDVSSE